MSRAVHAILWFGILSLVGCQTFRGSPARSRAVDDELRDLQKYFDPEQKVKEYDAAQGDVEKRTTLRNEIVVGRMRAADLHFSTFEDAMTQESAGLNVGTDATVITLNAVGALVGPAQTKAVLHAISAGIIGIKGSIDKEVYYNKTIPVLLTKMEALRKDQEVVIKKGLELKDNQYPLEDALRDVEKYFQAGTVRGAIIGINAQAGSETSSANAELSKIAEFKYDRSRKLRVLRDRINAWMNKDPKNVDKLDEWLGKQIPAIGASAPSWVEASTTSEAMLKKAITDLKIEE